MTQALFTCESPGGRWALGAAIEEAANVGEVVEAVTLKLL